MKKRIFALVMSVCMLISMMPVSAIASDHVHDASCGYSAASECTHTHDSTCGYAEAVAGSACTHNCSDGTCSYVAASEGSPCGHSHDDSCGYAAASPCTFVPCDHSYCGYVEGSPCNGDTGCDHLAEDNCGYVEGVDCPNAGQTCDHSTCGYFEGSSCNHSEHTDCGYSAPVAGDACNHSHTVDCGYIEATDSQPCTHEHDDNCGYSEGSECMYVEPVHTCNWSDWTSLGNNTHYRKCTIDGCTESQRDDCSGGTATCKYQATCGVCGSYYGDKDPENHQFPNGYGSQIDDSYHSIVCSCGYVFVSSEEHDFGSWYDEDDGMQYRICGDCYYTQTREAPHSHAWSTAWTNSDTHHWHECSADGCGVTDNSSKDGYAEHVYVWGNNGNTHWQKCSVCSWSSTAAEGHQYDDDSDTTCDICGYVRTVHTHNWGEAWTNSDTHHWHECSADGCGVTDNSSKDGYAEHSYTDDSDATCDCGYTRAVETHTHSYTAVVTAPTCNDQGYTTYICSCNDSYVGDYKSELGHAWSDYVSIGDGMHRRICGNDSSHQQSEACGGDATCHELAVCPDCGASHGSYDSTNHSGGTELRNAKAATETEDGYTGDTYCSDCQNIIEYGKTIPATGSSSDDDDDEETHIHDWGSWELLVRGRHRRICQTDSTHWEEGSCSYKVTNVGYDNHELTCSGCGDCLWVDHHFAAVDDEVHTYICTVCEFKTGFEHLYNIYKYDGTSHWLVCDCGLDKPNTVEEHSFGEMKSSEEKHWSVCTVCEYATQAQSHTYSAATCTAPATCSCGATKGNKNPNNHTGGTEIRGVVTATHTAKGYTGDTYCLGCGAKIADGRITNPTGYVNVKYGDDVMDGSVSFLPGDGVTLPEDTEIVVENHTVTAGQLDGILNTASTHETVVLDDERIEVGEPVTITYNGKTYKQYEFVVIDGTEYFISSVDDYMNRLHLIRLCDNVWCDLTVETGYLHVSQDIDQCAVPTNKTISINGVTYEVKCIFDKSQSTDNGREQWALYYDGEPVGSYFPNQGRAAFNEGCDPATLAGKQDENDLGTVTTGENPATGLNANTSYDVSVIGAQDISLTGTADASGTVTQTFELPTQFVGSTNVTYVAAHVLNPYATELTIAKREYEESLTKSLLIYIKEAEGRYKEALQNYEEWEKENAEKSYDFGTIALSEDGKTLTATYTVDSFSPFIVYAFVEADEPEIKTLSATIVDGTDDTTEAPDTDEPMVSPQTSDNTIWIVLVAAVAGAIAVVSVVYGKRRKSKAN